MSSVPRKKEVIEDEGVVVPYYFRKFSADNGGLVFAQKNCEFSTEYHCTIDHHVSVLHRVLTLFYFFMETVIFK